MPRKTEFTVGYLWEFADGKKPDRMWRPIYTGPRAECNRIADTYPSVWPTQRVASQALLYVIPKGTRP
jgi:hypothetical protein